LSTSTLKQKIEGIGAGVFIRDRAVESRLTESDFHRAFREPVIVWFTPQEYKKDQIDAVLDAAKKLHAVQCFRFPNVSVPSRILDRIRSEFPNTKVTGVE
jgi:hypothetical protein